MNEDVYAPPQSDIEATPKSQEIIASRWDRLWASLIDTIIQMVVIIPVMYYSGVFQLLMKGQEPSLQYNLAMAGVGLITFIVFNIKFLISTGQTIGKKVLGIKIVDLQGQLPSIKTTLPIRYAVFFIPAQIPIIGQLLSIINILFIFGKEKRCLHDFAAGTRVVKV